MTAQPRQHRDRSPRPAGSSRRISGPPPHEDGISAGTAGRACGGSHGGRLAYAVREAARLTGLSRDPLDDQMRLSNPVCVKVGTRRLITCQRLQFLGIVS
jgi:hypothetical protein